MSSKHDLLQLKKFIYWRTTYTLPVLNMAQSMICSNCYIARNEAYLFKDVLGQIKKNELECITYS